MAESRYLTRSDLNIDNLLKEKKIAKIMIIFASLGIFASLTATPVFFFRYKLALTPIFGLISGNIVNRFI